MTISLIIPYYKQIAYLELVIEAIKKQSVKPFEIIIAEDDNSPLTKELIERNKNTGLLSEAGIKHVCQEHRGFRKNKILNEAIKCSQGELIVFLDGDCIPHKHFIFQYLKQVEEKTILYGRRVNLSKKQSEFLMAIERSRNKAEAYSNKSLLTLFNLYRYGSKRIEEGIYLPFNIFNKKKQRGICGCNWGILKKHLIDVNGFDEDYERAGVGEDSDIDWRLRKSGCSMKSLKNKAIVYHLYHDSNFKQEEINFNLELMKQKQAEGIFVCRNGIVKKH